MYKIIAIISALLASVSMYAQSAANATPVQVTVNSETKDLAQGYARAASKLTRPPVTLAFQKDGVMRILEDVRSIQDSEGILVVEVGKGLIYLINPKDVVYITDGNKVPPAKTDVAK
jgi:hypothetical protein